MLLNVNIKKHVNYIVFNTVFPSSHRISRVMVSLLDSISVYRGLEP